MLPFTDIIALILGIFLTTRKLDIARREVEDYGHVSRDDFEAWKAQELNAYRVASSACFLKVIVGFGLFIAVRTIDFSIVRVIDGIVHLAWIGGLVVGFVISRRARATRERLGIQLVAPAAAPSDEGAKKDGQDSSR